MRTEGAVTNLCTVPANSKPENTELLRREEGFLHRTALGTEGSFLIRRGLRHAHCHFGDAATGHFLSEQISRKQTRGFCPTHLVPSAAGEAVPVDLPWDSPVSVQVRSATVPVSGSAAVTEDGPVSSLAPALGAPPCGGHRAPISEFSNLHEHSGSGRGVHQPQPRSPTSRLLESPCCRTDARILVPALRGQSWAARKETPTPKTFPYPALYRKSLCISALELPSVE